MLLALVLLNQTSVFLLLGFNCIQRLFKKIIAFVETVDRFVDTVCSSFLTLPVQLMGQIMKLFRMMAIMLKHILEQRKGLFNIDLSPIMQMLMLMFMSMRMIVQSECLL